MEKVLVEDSRRALNLISDSKRATRGYMSLTGVINMSKFGRNFSFIYLVFEVPQAKH